ncbi:helix-turn-helix domain-containing protein [Jiangella alkaliphila]|uniref:helix-turn-helix domain-containing protein n=1 Tax=Jiangella alkaliphila TaxID=419479 RepID=UPI0007C7F6A1|nr:helix-turn-helix domain-containing protein [Jiangella alkaliphila]
MLHGLGLSDVDESVYRSVLRRRPGSIAELARTLELSRHRVEKAIQHLRALGLLQPGAPGQPPTAADPEIAIPVLLRQRHEQLEDVTTHLPALAAEHRLAAFGDAHHQAVEVIVGSEEIRHRTAALAATANEFLIFDRPPYAYDPSGEVEGELPFLERGVTIRVVYDSTALQDPLRLANVRTLAAHGEQARVLPKVPLKLTIFDQHTAVVPLTREEVSESVALVHESGLLDALLALFETLWSSAPVLDRPHDTAPIPPEDADLLTLLAMGVKDAAVARQLGVSIRTARRRISGIMDRLGATSRFQAGRESERRGWL